jgi:hypothetical protein
MMGDRATLGGRGEERYRNVERQIAALLQSITLPEPQFPYRVGWAHSYDALFTGDYEVDAPAKTLVDEAKRRGRVIVHGEAGAGKTTLLLRLLKEHADLALPVFINLRAWTPPLFDQWQESIDNPVTQMHLLMTELGRPTTNEDELAALRTRKLRLIMVDGLNEVPRDVARGVLEAVDAFARRNTMAGAIVTDRLTRRDLPGDHWRIARLQPVGEQAVMELLEGAGAAREHAELLQRPFFLNLAIHEGVSTASSSGALAAYIERHVEPTRDELFTIARAAYGVYEEHQSRTFDSAEVEALIGRPLMERLQQAGVIERSGAAAYFAHHLYHDYLAAVWIASDSDRWTRSAFDAASFHASSFDALALALEQVEEPARADDLLRRIYDWNFYASAYALAKGRQLGSIAVTEPMEIALLAMLGERQWDPLKATAESVKDALLFEPSGFARSLLQADSLEEVQHLVTQHDADDDGFRQWQALFLTPTDAEVGDEVVDRITDERSLIGWTASNVLRRARLNEQQMSDVRKVLEEHDEWRARWRAAHALGSHPSSANAEALARALEDQDEWVRYGAVRALIEEAAASNRLRRSIIGSVVERVDVIAKDPRTLGELQRALVLREPPDDWADAVAPLVEELWSRASTVEGQDRWRRVAYDVQRQAVA